jgi:hypothetical protein
MQRRLTRGEEAHRLGRIRRLMATTPDWKKWFTIDLETLIVRVIQQPQWKAQE